VSQRRPLRDVSTDEISVNIANTQSGVAEGVRPARPGGRVGRLDLGADRHDTVPGLRKIAELPPGQRLWVRRDATGGPVGCKPAPRLRRRRRRQHRAVETRTRGRSRRVRRRAVLRTRHRRLGVLPRGLGVGRCRDRSRAARTDHSDGKGTYRRARRPACSLTELTNRLPVFFLFCWLSFLRPPTGGDAFWPPRTVTEDYLTTVLQKAFDRASWQFQSPPSTRSEGSSPSVREHRLRSDDAGDAE